jgi:hypothetical protein
MMPEHAWNHYSMVSKFVIPTVGTIFIAKMSAKTATDTLKKRGGMAVGVEKVGMRLQK